MQESAIAKGGAVLEHLPFKAQLETPAVLRKLVRAHRRLAELRGFCAILGAQDLSPIMPRLAVLSDLFLRQEALDSLAIEGVRGDYARLLESELLGKSARGQTEARIANTMAAMQKGMGLMRKDGGRFSKESLLLLQTQLAPEESGYRDAPGALVKNMKTDEIVYAPPQDAKEILALLANWLAFAQDDGMAGWDPLVKLAVLHHQFECIRPFMAANGRMGRLLNLLYLVQKDLLNPPLLLLSGYVRQRRDEYYRLLRQSRWQAGWEEWLLYVLDGVQDSARHSSILIWNIVSLMVKYHKKLERQWPKIASADLLHNLFTHPYTNIDLLMRDLQISRLTAAKYLRLLASGDKPLLHLQRVGRNNFYINRPLVALFARRKDIGG